MDEAHLPRTGQGNPGLFSLSVDAFGRLVLTDPDGRRFVGVEPIRLFPLTDPNHWISFCDPEGRDVLTIEDPAQLPPATRKSLEAELAQREFLPVITRILSMTSPSPPSSWEVETDRGPSRVCLDGEEQVRTIKPHHLLIASTTGVRFQVPDVRTLDARSRALLERYL